jgi:hypothetical protein
VKQIQPVVLLRAGVFTSESDDYEFFPKLAFEVNADYGLYMDYRRKYSPESSLDPEAKTQIDENIIAEAKDSLIVRRNFVVEGCYTAKERRDKFRQMTDAPEVGAAVITLATRSDWDVIERRIVMRHHHHLMDVSHDYRSTDALLETAEQMLRKVEWPDESEAHIDIDGTLPADMVINQVKQVLTANGHLDS